MNNYDLELKQKMQEIEDKILAKHGIKKKININNLGAQPKRGRVGDLKAKAIRETFDFSDGTLKIWRNGSRGVGRQRLFALLYSLDIEVYKELQEILKEEIRWIKQAVNI